MRGWKRLVSLVLLTIIGGATVFAQGESEITPEEVILQGAIIEPVLAVIHQVEPIEVNRAAIFDASSSVLPETYTKVVYTWSFGDGNSDQGVEVVHSYAAPGEYTVALNVEVDGEPYGETNMEVFVYSQFYVLITDQSDEEDRIESLVSFARDRGVYVHVIAQYGAASEFIIQEELFQRLNESLSTLEKTKQIIVWMEGSNGLTLLSRFSKNLTDTTVFGDKTFFIITDSNFLNIRNIADGTFGIIEPTRMILTRSEALWMLFEKSEVEDFIVNLESRGVPYEEITGVQELRVWNFMSIMVNFMVERGVPTNSLLLILMLPVIVTIVAFLKQVIGLTTMGVYTPSIITLSFVALDIKFGLAVFVLIILFGTLSRLFLRRYRLLYIPRMAIVLTLMSFIILLILLAGAYFHISQLVSISIFPMLIISTMVEKFVNVQVERGLKEAFVMIGSTLFVSIVAYTVVEWSLFKTLILGYPELIFIFLLIDIFLARWPGLRLLEYIRFREIFRYSEEE